MRVEGRSSFIGSSQIDNNNKENVKKILDWFSLCRAGGVKELSRLKSASFKGKGIKEVKSERFEEFTSLRNIDLTSNYVPLESLASFPCLQKVCLQRNRLQSLNVPPLKFASIQELDVSYNKLKAPSMIALATLPDLRTLNIDYNYLGKIPEEIGVYGAFPSLQKLSAAGNGLHSSSLIPLSKIRRLTHLNLSKNSISCLPEEVLSWPRPFERLKELDLSFNCLKEPYTLACLRALHHLHKVILWGNPVAKNVGNPVIKAFLQARHVGQAWALEQPQPPRHTYQRFTPVSRPQSCLLNDAELLQATEFKENETEKSIDDPDLTLISPAQRSAFGASKAYMSLKRELAFPPAPSEIKRPHYWAPPKRAEVPAYMRDHHPSLLERVRKVQAEEYKQRTDVILKGMQERLRGVESNLTDLIHKMTPLCQTR